MMRRGPLRADAGFTLTELLVALGIFSVLMAIVTTLYMRGMNAVQTGKAVSTIQVQQENAVEWISRLLRYTDNPAEGASPPAAITEATRTAMTFTTYSGTGPVDRVPYKARLYTNGPGVVSEVSTPALTNGTAVLTNGVPTYPTAPVKRVLVRTQAKHTPSLSFRYWADVNGVISEVTPAVGGTLTAQQMKDLTKVEVTISDSGSVAGVSQTVLLVNER